MRRILVISRDFINIISNVERMHSNHSEVLRGNIIISPGGSCHYISIFAESVNIDVEYLIITSKSALFNVVSEELKRLHVRFSTMPLSCGSSSLINYVYGAGGKLEKAIEQNGEVMDDGPDVMDYIGDNIKKFSLVIADSSIPKNSMKSVSSMCEQSNTTLWVVNSLLGADRAGGQIKCDANFTRVVNVPTSLSNKKCMFICESNAYTTMILHNGPKAVIPVPKLTQSHQLFRYMGGRDLFILYMAESVMDARDRDTSKGPLIKYMGADTIKRSMQKSMDTFSDLCKKYAINSSTTLESVIDILENNAYVDNLTRAYNRHYASKMFHDWKSYSVLFIDADNFKRINDNLGHDKGDDALRIIADTIRAHLRSEDIIMRWGGEEFVCILPESDKKSAIYAAERILNGLRNATFDYQLTASIGVSDSLSGDLDKCISAADKLMYIAKTTGKNKVVS